MLSPVSCSLFLSLVLQKHNLFLHKLFIISIIITDYV